MPSDDPEITRAAESVFDELVADLILTSAISAHREIKRGRVVCGTCGTRCRAHFPLGPASSSSVPVVPASQGDTSSYAPSRTASPQPAFAGASSSSSQDGRGGGYTTGPEKGTGGSTGIGSGSGRLDANGNVFFDCLVCGRAVVSTRYAPHLSSCLGLGGSTRRGAARSAAVKARLGASDRSSPSPYVASENGDSDADSASGKKTKKILNGNGKRVRSPSKPPSLGKKAKFASGTATPVGRPSLPPSKLGRPPTVGTASPASVGSPDFSVVSSLDAGGAQKTLPGVSVDESLDGDGIIVVPDDSSSDGEDPDDY